VRLLCGREGKLIKINELRDSDGLKLNIYNISIEYPINSMINYQRLLVNKKYAVKHSSSQNMEIQLDVLSVKNLAIKNQNVKSLILNVLSPEKEDRSGYVWHSIRI
jgi:hypothetical protein